MARPQAEPGEGRSLSLNQAKVLRRRMTEAESRLWTWLRAHRLGDHKFKRQVPIGSYIVDFACLSRKLVVEVDGGQHAESLSDKRRDAWLRMQGFEVLRFWNSDVLKKTEGVLALILEALEHRPSPGALRASSSPRRGEVKDLGSH
jgi:very-short-patch-repair endonuclease